MPLSFWWDAFNTAVYLINRLPTLLLNNQSPMRKLYHQEPDYSFLRYFGCAYFPHIRPHNKNKFDFHSLKCVFMGYSSLHKGYKCPSSSGKIYIAHNVVFDEQTFPFSMGFSIIPTLGSYKKTMSTTPTSRLPVVLPQLDKPISSVVKKSVYILHSQWKLKRTNTVSYN